MTLDGEESEQGSENSQEESPAGRSDAAPESGPQVKVRSHRVNVPDFRPDLKGKVKRQGRHSGDRYMRVVRRHSDDLTPVRDNYLIASDDIHSGRGPIGRMFNRTKRVMIGAPLTTSSAIHERLTKFKALAVLSSDALSSVAYASEEILRVLIIAGLGALSLSLPIGGAIIALIFIVGFSYRQTIKAYPHGGGSYIVAHDNLGDTPALVAGGALLVDYTLTVAVSISSAVGALVSAVPEVHDHLVLVGVAFIVLTTMLNLRGIRESGTIFAFPTYFFLISIAIMIGVGIVRNAAEGFEVHEPQMNALVGSSSVTLFLILRAFSSGCSAMTGVEAISDGVPAFKPPEWVNARQTLSWMVGILAVTFAGITFLAHQYGAVAMSQSEAGYQTVVAQIATGVFGSKTIAYYVIQGATMMILVLAANTAYSDFPRLSYFMARDKFMPSQFTFRGDRLAYSTGIITLGLLSTLVLVIFGGETERLIPLYAVGVFTSFTLSQAGMVVRWQRLKEPGWKQGRFVNALGAVVTGIVALVVAITKFTHGAWMVILLIPILVMMFKGIHRHYTSAAEELAEDDFAIPDTISNVVVVPISSINRNAAQTIAYARAISNKITAVHIADEEAEIRQMQEKWKVDFPDVPLVIIESPYRSLVGPFLSYLDELQEQVPGSILTVVMPEYIPSHWWEQILHNQTALRLKAALLFRANTVVTSVPYHLQKDQPVRQRFGRQV